jgi:putative FmdB family regulatory protein
MPLYEYMCQDCDGVFELRRPFSEADKSAVCPSCSNTNTRKRLTISHFISQSTSIPVPLSKGGGCGCGGHCACQH